MPKLLYTATGADGRKTEGFVDAASAEAARDQLQRQGLRDVVLHQEVMHDQDSAEIEGLTPAQQQALARMRLRMMRSPGLTPALVETARRAVWWLLADAALVFYGVSSGQREWVLAGLLAAVAPFALTAWNWRHAGRYQQLLKEFAVGNWDAVRSLAQQLRVISQSKPMIDFDLDVRLACIDAREKSLEAALARLDRWRDKFAKQPGLFEIRASAVYLAAGDTAGFVRLMSDALTRQPDDPARKLDAALAHARFGEAARAAELLQGVDAGLLPPHARGFANWARGLLQLRARDQAAVATLGSAVADFLQLTDQPAVWTALGLATCDHAVALAQAGRRDEARRGIAHVWPIVRAHAPTPLLRMLENDDLLPTPLDGVAGR